MPARARLQVCDLGERRAPQFASCATDCVVVAAGVVSDRVPVLLSCRCGSRRNACCRLDSHLPASAPWLLLVLAEQSPASTPASLLRWTRTTRLAGRGGRLHRPGDPRVVRTTPRRPAGATASVGHRMAASRRKPTAGSHHLRPCADTIASTTAAASCPLCLCHGLRSLGPAGATTVSPGRCASRTARSFGSCRAAALVGLETARSPRTRSSARRRGGRLASRRCARPSRERPSRARTGEGGRTSGRVDR